MKRVVFALLILFASASFAQNYSQWENIPLVTAAEFRKAEPQVMLAADLVLSTPIEKTNKNRLNAISFIMKWMGGTSDYSFVLDETMRRVTYGDKDMLGVYFACLSKYAIQKGKGADREDIRIKSYAMLAAYCENPDNNIKVRGEIKKLVDAKNQNKMKEYLDSKKK
ncbi:MAG: hypothetical protein WCR72_01255 [Bacteroidota bacterium]